MTPEFPLTHADAAETRSMSIDARLVGMWFFLATVIMLFAGFTSAILVRRAMPDWQPLPHPALLWLNTAVLLASSLTLERTRDLARRNAPRAARLWLVVTGLLALLFLGGQVGVWQQLRVMGIFLPSNPHSSFFYILTGAHAAHLVGGLLFLAYLLLRPVSDAALRLCATYWHFLGGLWLYLFVLLFII